MPICKNCANKWTWKQTVKKTTTLNPEMICPYCGEKQYQSRNSKAVAPFLSLVVLLPLLVNILFDVPAAILLGLLPIIAVIIFLVYPFTVKLSCEEEYISFSKDK